MHKDAKRSYCPISGVTVVSLIAVTAGPPSLLADPGQPYTIREQALEAAIHDVQRSTLDNNHDAERGSVVYEQPDGSFTYTAPAGASDGEHDFGPTLSDVSLLGGIPTDLAHSHNDPGSYRPGLSEDDVHAGDITRTDIHAVEGGRSADDPVRFWTRGFENEQTTRTTVGKLDDLLDTQDCPPPPVIQKLNRGGDPDGDDGKGCSGAED
jgi:hypothetical protein